MVRKLIAGNWKMNGLRADGLALARALVVRAAAGDPPDCALAICPPATLLIPIADTLRGSGIRLGGQDCHAEAKGAHTGDISAVMLKDAGCVYVIVGHSERRAEHGETDAVVHAKASAAHAAGLVPILCIGETLAERDAGETLAVVERQLRGSMPEGLKAPQIVIAYEPVWAIGTGKTATPAQAQEAHHYIRQAFAKLYGDAAAESVRILYGGSVKPDNMAALMKEKDIDGGLVGGASLDPDSFAKIVLYDKSPVTSK